MCLQWKLYKLSKQKRFKQLIINCLNRFCLLTFFHYEETNGNYGLLRCKHLKHILQTP
jgi:hypothetical protein